MSGYRETNLIRAAFVMNCLIHTKNKIGTLAQNVSDLYSKLLSTIELLEPEKKSGHDIKRVRVDFPRAASHELKAPVTARNATLENMILGIRKYLDYSACPRSVKKWSSSFPG